MAIAEVIGTELTGQDLVADFEKPVGMPDEGHFPGQQNNDRYHQEAGRVKSGHEQRRRHHHDLVPVENTTSRTAAVFHQKPLKGTPEQDTDQIRDIKEYDQKK